MWSSTVLGALAAGFTVLAAVFGLLAWGKSHFEGKAKDTALQQFKIEALGRQTQFETELEAQREKTEEQREKTAKAELQLKRISDRQAPRVSLAGALLKSIEGIKPAKAEILYQEGDNEVYLCAFFLKAMLFHEKWEVAEPRPIGDNDRSGEMSGIPIEEVRKWPPPQRVGAMINDITLIGNRDLSDVFDHENKGPTKDLSTALHAAGFVNTIARDKSLPDDFVRIVVAPR